MTTYEIIPFHSVGGAEFGSSPSEVRSHLGSEFTGFRRGSEDVPSDHFAGLGVFAYYDADAKLEAIELASPAIAIFEGLNLSRMGMRELTAALGSRDANLLRLSDSIRTAEFGISLWFPDWKEAPDAVAEAILAHRKGYYD